MTLVGFDVVNCKDREAELQKLYIAVSVTDSVTHDKEEVELVTLRDDDWTAEDVILEHTVALHDSDTVEQRELIADLVSLV